MAIDPLYSKALGFIMQNQNGEAAKQMNHAGIAYNMNYGVSLLMLKDFAQSIGYNQTLAQQLWSENIRETRLLSIFLRDPEKITPDEADGLVNQLSTGELVENASQHLFWKMPFAEDKIAQWIPSDETFVKMAGIFTAFRLVKMSDSVSENFFGLLFDLIKSETDQNVIYIKKGLSLLLINMASKSSDAKERVSEFIEKLDPDNSEACRFIVTNVSAELNYV